jgi:PleD family two-component response regulator
MVASRFRPPHILVASQDALVHRDIARTAQRHGYTVLQARTAFQALQDAPSARPDLVIVDEALRDIDSLDTSRALRDDPVIGPSTPILLVTAGRPTTAEHRVALRAGVWEFLVHPFVADELSTKLLSYVLLKLNADQARDAAALTDETGLYTDRGLALRARELTLQAFHHRAPLACVAFAPLVPSGRDQTSAVDFFARVLKTSGRRSDAIGRIGPRRFAVVAPATDDAGAVGLANRLARAARAASPGAPLLRAGYDAVPNARAAPIEPTDLFARATRALEAVQASGSLDWIRSSEA